MADRFSLVKPTPDMPIAGPQRGGRRDSSPRPPAPQLGDRWPCHSSIPHEQRLSERLADRRRISICGDIRRLSGVTGSNADYCLIGPTPRFKGRLTRIPADDHQRIEQNKRTRRQLRLSGGGFLRKPQHDSSTLLVALTTHNHQIASFSEHLRRSDPNEFLPRHHPRRLLRKGGQF